ncbi:LEM domain [Dermatophagoides farinae]|uniref:LEM domain n=1 Tax=Dermatophagoides farinae TaxID=6954 RepID=A0A922L1E1_DERFA|nr:LEM domain [Dermatophagoides farinae]
MHQDQLDLKHQMKEITIMNTINVKNETTHFLHSYNFESCIREYIKHIIKPLRHFCPTNITDSEHTLHNISTDIFKTNSFSFDEARRLEREMLSQCSSSWLEKRNSIVYFLIDPSMLKNLPPKKDSSLESELIDPHFFFQFISSIFYVGCGLIDRPDSHFLQALNERMNPTNLDPSPKIQRIFSLMDRFIEPTIYHAQENLSKQESFMYEAIIIETISLKNLTNKTCGNNLKKLNMNTRQRKVLGTYLMCEIFKKYGSKFGLTVFAGN